MRTSALALALLSCVALAAMAVGAERTASVSGDWSAKETWGGETVPGDGDTVVVKDDAKVNVSDERIVGASGAKGTLAVNLGKTGELVIAKGGLLRVRGDVAYTPASTQPAVTVQGGGTWRWDASKAAAPKDTQYRFRATAESGFRPFILSGTADAHAVLDSDIAGAPGCFTRDGKVYGGGFAASYADIARIGDAKTPGWDIRPLDERKALLWDVQHSTFTHCGLISVMSPPFFRHNYNAHFESQGPAVFGDILVVQRGLAHLLVLRAARMNPIAASRSVTTVGQ